MLAELLDEAHAIEVQGETVRTALADLIKKRPVLGLHLIDEDGLLRRHIRCFYRDALIREELETQLQPGDRITIIHAISAG
jgi:hypothetical protein